MFADPGSRGLLIDPPDFLDYPGTELVRVGAHPDPRRELGVALRPERETLERVDIFRKLKLDKDVHPLRALTTREWA
jgi:hypothetical protein